MANISHKRRNKRLWTGGIITVLALLIISFVISRGGNTIDPASFADVQVFEVTAHEKGNLESEVRLIEYSDFQCPACRAAAPSLDEIVTLFGDQFVFEYRHFPLRNIHPNAQLAAQASEAAALQGKFWEMHDMLFEKQDEWAQSFNPERFFRNYAEEIGLHDSRFRYDLHSNEVKDKVNSHFDEASALNLPGTPSFVVDGQVVDLNEFLTHTIDMNSAISAELISE